MAIHSNNRWARAVQMIVPVAVIIAGNFAGIGWLSTLGAIALGWVVASALLRDVNAEALPSLRSLWFALAAPAVIGLVLIAVLLWNPAPYIMLPVLAAGVVLVYLAIGNLVWWLIRLNKAT
jgi:hypothetical protein